MDATPKETLPRQEVKRSFEGSRSAMRLMTTAYEWVVPGMRCRNDAEPAHRTCGEAEVPSEARVSTARRATGA